MIAYAVLQCYAAYVPGGAARICRLPCVPAFGARRQSFNIHLLGNNSADRRPAKTLPG